MKSTSSWTILGCNEDGAFKSLKIGATGLALVFVIAVATAQAQLLVGVSSPSFTNSVLKVNTSVPQVTGIFGSALNFNPDPGSMAQDSQGRVYILESNLNRVRRYDRSGNFLGYFASGGFGGGLSLVAGIAIDSADNVYISSGGANSSIISDDTIARFSSSGTPLGTFGQASNSASGYIAGGPLAFDHQGNLYAGYAGQIVRYAPNGTSLGVFATTPSELGLAFNSQGDLFVSGAEGVHRFSSTGTPLGTFANDAGSTGLAFDSVGNLFVASPDANTLNKYGPNGALLATIGSPAVGRPSSLLFLTPEPTSLILLVSAMGMFAVGHPRRRSPAC